MYRKTGLSLIELIIVLLVISLLASFSVRSYKPNEIKNERLYALTILHHSQMWLESFFEENLNYKKSRNNVDINPNLFASKFGNIPFDETTPTHKLTLISVSDYEYKVQLKALNGDDCNIMTIDNFGNKTLSPKSGSGLSANNKNDIALCFGQ